MQQPNKSTQNVTEAEQLHSLTSQIQCIDKHEATLSQILSQLQTNLSNLQELDGRLCTGTTNQRLASLHPPAAAPQPEPIASSPAAPAALPMVCEQNLRSSKIFEGNPELCESFTLQCNLKLQQAPQLYSSDAAKISYLISQLKGDVLHWANSYMYCCSLDSLRFPVFLEESL